MTYKSWLYKSRFSLKKNIPRPTFVSEVCIRTEKDKRFQNYKNGHFKIFSNYSIFLVR